MKNIQKLIQNNKIIVIGITGGVGCGKSMIINYMLERYNAKIYITDEIGHKVMEPGTEGYNEIIKTFGNKIIRNDGFIDRAKLASIVFNDKVKLSILNSIIHPEVEKYIINNIIDEYNKDGHKLFVIESALLIEAGYKNICNEIWYVYANTDIRIKRLMSARGYSKEKCLNIIKNQLSDEIFREESDFIINNENDLNITKNQIENHMNFCYNYNID